MKKILFPVLTALLLFAPAAFADPGGSGQRGFTFSLGYDLNYMHYEERGPSDIFLDRDEGYTDGFAAEARYETGSIWSRLSFEEDWALKMKYEGFLQTIPLTPLQIENFSEEIRRCEADLGYKVLDIGRSTLTPYLGIGYRWWMRGEDSLPAFNERYTWHYYAAGLNYIWRADRWSAGLDLSAHLPFNMRMQTNTAGTTNEGTFHLAKIMGLGAELPVTYSLTKRKLKSRARFFLFVTPYYQYWPVGASPLVTLIRTNGSGSLQAYEPSSRTNTYGAKTGVGVNF